MQIVPDTGTYSTLQHTLLVALDLLPSCTQEFQCLATVQDKKKTYNTCSIHQRVDCTKVIRTTRVIHCILYAIEIHRHIPVQCDLTRRVDDLLQASPWWWLLRRPRIRIVSARPHWRVNIVLRCNLRRLGDEVMIVRTLLVFVCASTNEFARFTDGEVR